MTTDDPLVTLRHVRAARFCLASVRAWFPQHGLSWQEFLERGLPASVLEATGSEPALVVCRIAREEASQRGH